MTPQRVELINTGSELLLGNVRDAHLEWFGKELIGIGLRISRQTTVPDGSDILSALREAFKRCDVILVTGGLGPTTDDITRELASESLCLPLIKDQEVLRRIQDYCHVRGIPFNHVWNVRPWFLQGLEYFLMSLGQPPVSTSHQPLSLP